jgi:site-specific DNA-methyltransferase (adenine-specific)
MIQLINDDCLKAMDKLIEDGVKVDTIITDSPYGTTACKWDTVIPFDAMWERLNKLIKPNGAIVLFGSEPFSSALRMSNIKNYKYDWVWEKDKVTGFLNSKKQPLRNFENILLFYKKQPTYNPQFTKKDPKNIRPKMKNREFKKRDVYSNFKDGDFREQNIDVAYPKQVLKFNQEKIGRGIERFHPTQKPVALMEYLIKTYTNENDLVLDFTMGSGTTGVACKNLNRSFIGIELDEKYFEIAKNRIENSGSLF